MKKPTSQIRIIMTDDDEDDRMFFNDAMKSLNLNCVLEFCENGQVLLEKLTNEDALPDLVFLDLNMPILSGLETLERIRNNDKFLTIPVIAIYSTSSDSRDKEKSLELGANAFITKPTNFEELKKIVHLAVTTDWKNRKDIAMENFILGKLK